jgi:XRE family transcriptional regulator, fatty acid utilization regulator
MVGKPASYLSQLENGHREPRLSTVGELAAALDCSPAELLDPTPPSRRSELELAVVDMQADPRYRHLKLPYLRPTARTDDVVLEHLVSLWEQVRDQPVDGAADGLALAPGSGIGAEGWGVEAQGWAGAQGGGSGARQANAKLREEMRQRDNYFGEIERVAGAALDVAGYTSGAVAERTLSDLADHFGFRIARVKDLPPSTRSISDQRNRVIYVPQRNNTTTRAARSVIAQTLGHFALGHHDPQTFEDYVRQRVEANYFAGALLAPERAVVAMLHAAKARRDLSVEDLAEVFYISYEMAAHRLTNLITEHLDIPVHFQRSDPEGVLWKAYENDGVPLPADADGTIEGQRLCRWWSARQAFESDDAFSLHYQYTDTVNGAYWCATHIEIERENGDAVTIGTTEANSRWFRGSDTSRRAVSRCPDSDCCRRPPAQLLGEWEGTVWPSARDHSHFVSGLPTDTVTFNAFPGVDMVDVYSFMERHRPPATPSPSRRPPAPSSA